MKRTGLDAQRELSGVINTALFPAARMSFYSPT